MLATMRRLHPRGRESRGIVLDAHGAMLGPDCTLVRRTPAGFRCVAPSEARAIQALVLGPGHDPDWLFEQSRRIARALGAGETALAQIYGLRIQVGELDDAAFQKLAAVARLIKAGFDPNEPRIPQGEPGAGQWTYEPGYAKPQAGHGQPGGDEGGDQAPATSEGSSGSGEGGPPSDAGGDESPRIPSGRTLQKSATALCGAQQNGCDGLRRRAPYWHGIPALGCFLRRLKEPHGSSNICRISAPISMRRRASRSFRIPLISRNLATRIITLSSGTTARQIRWPTRSASESTSKAARTSFAFPIGSTSRSAPGIRATI